MECTICNVILETAEAEPSANYFCITNQYTLKNLCQYFNIPFPNIAPPDLDDEESEEKFKFCSECTNMVEKLCELNENLEEIRKEIVKTENSIRSKIHEIPANKNLGAGEMTRRSHKRNEINVESLRDLIAGPKINLKRIPRSSMPVIKPAGSNKTKRKPAAAAGSNRKNARNPNKLLNKPKPRPRKTAKPQKIRKEVSPEEVTTASMLVATEFHDETENDQEDSVNPTKNSDNRRFPKRYTLRKDLNGEEVTNNEEIALKETEEIVVKLDPDDITRAHHTQEDSDNVIFSEDSGEDFEDDDRDEDFTVPEEELNERKKRKVERVKADKPISKPRGPRKTSGKNVQKKKKKSGEGSNESEEGNNKSGEDNNESGEDHAKGGEENNETAEGGNKTTKEGRNYKNKLRIVYEGNDQYRYGDDLRFTGNDYLGFKCSQCNNGHVFPKKKNMYDHLNHVHKRVHGKYQCPTCGKILETRCGFVVHLGTHEEGNSAICETCGKGFRSKSNLRQHTYRKHRKATQTAEVICEFCGKHCQQFNYRSHVRTVHFKQLKYFCDLCGKGFPNKYILTDHLTTHSKERNFSCDECGQRVKTKLGLYKHKKILHSNKGQMATLNKDSSSLPTTATRTTTSDDPQANESNANNGNPTTTVPTNPGNPELQCKFCGLQYNRPNNFTRHLKQVHHVNVKDLAIRRKSKSKNSNNNNNKELLHHHREDHDDDDEDDAQLESSSDFMSTNNKNINNSNLLLDQQDLSEPMSDDCSGGAAGHSSSVVVEDDIGVGSHFIQPSDLVVPLPPPLMGFPFARPVLSDEFHAALIQNNSINDNN